MSSKASGDGSSESALQVRAEHVTQRGGFIVVAQGDICLDDSDAIVNAADEAMQHLGGVAGAIVAAGGDVIQKESDEWVAKNGRVKTGSGAAVTTAGRLPCKHVIHVVGPIWREPISGETVARGEIVSQDKQGRFVALTEECGNLVIGEHTLATGYVPQIGDRVKILVGKKGGGSNAKGPREFLVRYCVGMKHTVEMSDEDLLKGCVLAALHKADELRCKSISLPAISSGVFGFPLAQCAQIIVTCAEEFMESAKHVTRVSMTNRNAPTVAAMIDVFRAKFGAACVREDTAKAAASKVLRTDGGKELKGPLLIVVDSSGAIVSKGYFFHGTGPHANNWVKGIPPPPDPLAAMSRTFDPRGDWSKGNYGTGQIPGMDSAPADANKPKKKKKNKSAGAAAAAHSDDSDDGAAKQPVQNAKGTTQRTEDQELGSKDDIVKRIRAVQKKLRQAEGLREDKHNGKQLNVDQENKVSSIGDMNQEIAQLEAKLASM